MAKEWDWVEAFFIDIELCNAKCPQLELKLALTDVGGRLAGFLIPEFSRFLIWGQGFICEQFPAEWGPENHECMGLYRTYFYVFYQYGKQRKIRVSIVNLPIEW